MAENWILFLSAGSVFTCALVGGVFLTFSDFVMGSLAAANPAGGIQAMQIINRKVFRTLFMVLLLGMSALAPVLGAYAYFTLESAASSWVLTGAVVYFVGTFLVTLIFNVPMNMRLDRMEFTSPVAATYWRTYVPVWSFWNWVRAGASSAASVCFFVACLILARGLPAALGS